MISTGAIQPLLYYDFVILCSCESSVFSVNNTGRIRVAVRTGIYVLVLCVSQTPTFHTRGKFWIEYFFFRIYHCKSKFICRACKYQEKNDLVKEGTGDVDDIIGIQCLTFYSQMIHLLFFNLIFYWMFSSVQSKVFSVLLHRQKNLVSIFLQWKRKDYHIYEQQWKYLHVLDIIPLSNLHWFHSVGFKTSSTSLWEEWRDFHWLQWSFCLWNDSRVCSKGNKIKPYWI